MDKLWNNVDKALALRSISLLQLSERCGISYDTIRGWRAKRIYPKVDDAKRIADTLSMSIEKVFFDVEANEDREELIRKLNDAECVLTSIRKLLETTEVPG